MVWFQYHFPRNQIPSPKEWWIPSGALSLLVTAILTSIAAHGIHHAPFDHFAPCMTSAVIMPARFGCSFFRAFPPVSQLHRANQLETLGSRHLKLTPSFTPWILWAPPPSRYWPVELVGPQTFQQPGITPRCNWQHEVKFSRTLGSLHRCPAYSCFFMQCKVTMACFFTQTPPPWKVQWDPCIVHPSLVSIDSTCWTMTSPAWYCIPYLP